MKIISIVNVSRNFHVGLVCLRHNLSEQILTKTILSEIRRIIPPFLEFVSVPQSRLDKIRSLLQDLWPFLLKVGVVVDGIEPMPVKGFYRPIGIRPFCIPESQPDRLTQSVGMTSCRAKRRALRHRYIDAVRRVQPKFPLLLIGYGKIALKLHIENTIAKVSFDV